MGSAVTVTATREPTRFAFSIFGPRVGVSVDDPLLAAEAKRLLPPGRSVTSWYALDVEFRLVTIEPLGGDAWDEGQFHLYRNEQRIEEPVGRWSALFMLERAIRSFVASSARGYLFIHAGVVAWRDAAIVVPGYSRTGKSTLVTALLDRGATYFSDEQAVIDTDGLVHPYPKPLYLRDRPRAVDRWRDVTTTAPAGDPRAAVPIGLVAKLEFDPAAGWAVEEVSTARAMMLLGDHCHALRQFPGEALALLARAVQIAEAIVGTRGEAAHAATELLHRLDR